MANITLDAVITNPIDATTVMNAGKPLTLRDLIVFSVNQPPQALPAAANPKHAAELRGGIIEKTLEKTEAEFLPEQTDEILACVAASQPATIYISVKKLLA